MHPSVKNWAISSLIPILINKQIHTQSTLWKGFMMFCKDYINDCLGVIIILPADAFSLFLDNCQIPDIVDKISKYVKENNIDLQEKIKMILLSKIEKK